MEDPKGPVPYTHEEKMLLAALVEQHKEVIENKRTDASSIQSKQREWERLTTTYNAQANVIGRKRSCLQLKRLWANLKQRKRKATTDLKYERLVTGGGPPPPVMEDPLLDAIEAAAPHADVEVPCLWDSTAVTVANKSLISELPASPVEEVSNDYEPGTSKTPRTRDKQSSSTLLRSTPKRKADKLHTARVEADLRIEKIRESIRHQEEVHRMKLEIMKEEKLKAASETIKAKAQAELGIAKLKTFNSNK